MSIRAMIEETEKSFLSPYATLASKSLGRERDIAPCDVRTAFQRDRDRIIHSKSFRRLKHKTQVFIIPDGDHYRTRLTHTLEVSQIARTLARGLKLNEDLTEAIALGHDLGHTPFGHAGEQALHEVCPDGFKHYEQSLRVVEKLENGNGMNLSFEVRDGIYNHTGTNMAKTLEGILVKFADRIAYVNHDIDDAVRGNILKKEDLPQDLLAILGETHGERLNTMIIDLINESQGKPTVAMSERVYRATMQLREFLFETVYVGSIAKKDDRKAQNIVKTLYEYFVKSPHKLPDEAKKHLEEESLARVVADHIAGMSDRYAISLFNELFIPSPWQKL